MSKRCCGIIYAEKDEVCFICGQPLKDDEEAVSQAEKKNETESTSEASATLESSDAKEDGESGEPEKSDVKKEEPADEFEIAATQSMDELALIPEKGEEETSYKTNMALLSAIFDTKEEEKKKSKKKVKKKDDTPRGIKVGGVLSIIMAVLGLVVVLLCGYFMVFAPSYDKKGAADKELIYPYAENENSGILRGPIVGTGTDVEPSAEAEQGGEVND